VYLILGDDEYRVSAKAKAVVNDVLPAEDQALGVEVVDGNMDTVESALGAVGQCLAALATVSLFGSRKLTWFRDVGFLSDNRIGGAKDVKARVNELAAVIKGGLPPDQVLVVTSPKVDRRYAFFKACKEAGQVHEFEVPEKAYLAERQGREQLREALKAAGLRMSSPVADAWLAKVGTDTRQIVSEVEKLSVYLGRRRDVQMDDVKRITSSCRNAVAWDLADAVGCRDLARSLAVARQLLFQKVSPIALVMAIQGRVRELLVYREALDQDWLIPRRTSRGATTVQWGEVPVNAAATFSEYFGRDPRSVHPYRVGLLAEQAKRFSIAELKECRRKAVKGHERLVTTSLPPLMVLEVLLVSMLTGAGQARKAGGPPRANQGHGRHLRS